MIVHRQRRGQALVELALILPLIVTLFCAVCHFGILYYLQVALEEGNRQAGLFAAYNPVDDAKIMQVMKDSLPDLVDKTSPPLFLKVVNASGSRAQGESLSLQIEYDIQLLKSLPFGAILPIPTKIHSLITVPIVSTAGNP